MVGHQLSHLAHLMPWPLFHVIVVVKTLQGDPVSIQVCMSPLLGCLVSNLYSLPYSESHLLGRTYFIVAVTVVLM